MYQKKLTKTELAAQLSVGLLFLIAVMTTGCVEVVDDKKTEDTMSPVSAHAQSAPEYDGWIEKNANYRYRGIDGVPYAYCWQNASGHRAQVEREGVKIDARNQDLRIEGCDLLVTSAAKVRVAGGSIIEIPMDHVFARDQALAAETTVIEIKTSGRIFVTGSTLSTQGRSLVLSAHEIIFQQAMIQNFSLVTVAADQKAGAAGGNITIQAQKVSGRLFADLRGQAGGRGAKGADGKDLRVGVGDVGFAGMSGGASGDLIFDVVDSSEFQVQMNFAGGAGGQGGDEGNPLIIGNLNCVDYACPVYVHKPDPKRAGPTGTPGLKGRCLELNPQSPRLCPQ
ncbi:MAG: hypothetical protein KF681_09975 [Bdellovibrionaceae bacterium]|nr:hypothetical protein [Pseudobdellovibrionaceae bacterium]